MRSFNILLLVLLSSLCGTARAEVKLPALFGSNMVLQRDANVAIWGKADPGEKVTVSVGAQKVAATADAGGKWKVQLAPLPAGGPVEMTIAGTNTITLKNVLIGDVWLGSGQSNMEFTVKGCRNAPAEIVAAENPQIRLFTVRRASAEAPKDDVTGQWVVCSPQTVPDFSAVLYFFGRELNQAEHVPMGLIHSSVGGTSIEAWTSRAGFESQAALKPLLERWDAARAAYAKTEKPGPKQAPVSPKYPTCLFNAMIAPLIPYTLKGATWYQGEADAGAADLYRTQMPTLIGQWRKDWGSDFPFFIVQLANYKDRAAEPTDPGWARLREAQLQTMQADPKVGMAVIIDVGDAKNIHPTDKQTVGKRLALSARAIAYGEKNLVYFGPLYQAMKVEGAKVRVSFTHVGAGLCARPRSDDESKPGVGEAPPASVPLKGFALAGANKKFSWATATIEGQDVIVSCDAVPAPVAVRYGWADNPDCNLYNQEGLPATPFRTDDWPTANK